MKRLRIEQDRSQIGHPDNWMVVERDLPEHGWNVLFRGTYCECLKEADRYVKTRRKN
jgi:hypothetical protein